MTGECRRRARDMRPAQLMSLVAFAVALGTYSASASAYVGPGMGMGVIGALLGTALAVLALIVGAVWYPIKKLLGRLRRKQH